MSKDTDGDRRPDVVKTTGMINQVGKFVEEKNGKSYFEMMSALTIPTNISMEAKIVRCSIDVNPNIKQSDSLEMILQATKEIKCQYTIEAIDREIAIDGLSETMYTGNANCVMETQSLSKCSDNQMANQQLEI